MAKINLLDRCIRSVITVLGFPLSLYQLAIARYELQKYQPTGKLVDIGGRKLHVVATATTVGEGSPTIILESGMGGCSLDWSLVVPELSKEANVISYDRSGLGWSTSTVELPTCSHYVNDLRMLLQAIGAKPPYLLVGHSYGGMIMRLFAARYPEETVGLVLVDSTHESRYLPDLSTRERKAQRKINSNEFRLGYLLSPIAIPRLLRKHIGSNRLPDSLRKVVVALGYRSNAFEAVYSELLCTQESSVQLLNAKSLDADLPVLVLTAGKQTKDWMQGQQMLSKLTKRTNQIIVEDSWHSIAIHKPDAVIKAIKSLLR